MLLIVFRESLKEEIHGLLKNCNVKAFTEVEDVMGIGETGPTDASFFSMGANSMILTALPHAHADQLVKELKAYRDRSLRLQHVAKFPLRVFVLPCEQMV